MGSLIEELRRREAAARAEADRLRTRIEELSEDLARTEEQASRLSIAREEVARVLGEPETASRGALDRGESGGREGHQGGGAALFGGAGDGGAGERQRGDLAVGRLGRTGPGQPVR
jgi:hypothetical protein